MESNKDEALRCISIAQKHFNAGNFPSARKFCLKSKSLFDTPEATKLLETVESAESSGSASSSSRGATNTQTEEHPSAAGMKHRHAKPAPANATKGSGTAGGMGGDKREYTKEQHEVVKRVRACKVTEYYEILAVSKDCEEGEIKKAYRKVG